MNNCCGGCKRGLCAKDISIFSSLDSSELTEIIEKMNHKRVNKNDVIFLEGEKAQTLYFLNVGKIKIYKYTKDGKEQILHILSEGDFFGELNLLKESKYRFNAKAIEESKICMLSKENFKEILLYKPEIAIKILEIMGERLSDVESLAQNLATNDIDARIAFLLKELSDKYGKNNEGNLVINLHLTREDMASYVGITRETISRKLKKFEEEGIIKIVGTKKIIIIDNEKLEEYI
ncbi:Crp/Fnr family transcriptional regulator [Clostridium bornimense]|uniref:Crp/Fnr family transcriptional regulator n=1 Tax=Clostridium bornimense TaxID=1216932 RepID=UPI001C0FB4BB|nr:Crp/Fnr family transcriptional regulator [Clostridium bornimense]MBU5316499.1 Crp/Fnr family transcriptional regulator [Clostridium bornimense]